MKSVLKHIVLLLLIFVPFFCLSQNEAANWYFGQRAGLNFNFGYPSPQNNGVIDTPEGCSTISNRRGELLFYSDGITVWNKNHQVMQNGTDLLGDKSSTQSALIVPKPEDDDIYYIFTVDDRARSGGLRYSEINMSLDGGLGGVTANKNILLANPTTEKITAVESSDGSSIWVISHRWNSDEYIAYLVSSTGVNTTPVVSSVGTVHQGDINNTIGYLKASPNREKIASVMSYTNSETQVFDFDASSGQLSNPITISNYSSDDIGPYGCEFSPNSNLLYITEIDRATGTSKLHQYDLTLPTQNDIINSDIIIAQENEELAAIQQAIDGRIYIAIQGGEHLALIADPNEIGAACNYNFNGVFLGGNSSHYGLPPFIQSYFFATNLFRNTCLGDTTEFFIDTSTVINSIEWNFGDPASGINNTSTDLSPTHVFTDAGEYTITITIETGGETQTIYRLLNISLLPEVLELEPLIACEIDTNVAEFDLITRIPQVYIDDDATSYTFYESIEDAENNVNNITNVRDYLNISNPQTVYIRLMNNYSTDCYSISELELQTFETPDIEETDTAFFCENTSNDSVTIDVGDLEGSLNDYTFLWLDTNETTPEIQVQNTGVYTVRITPLASITQQNPDGCYSDRVITVSSSSIATINDLNVTNDDNVTIFATGQGDYEYAIDDINGPYQDLNQFYDLEPGLHTVYVKDKNDCGIVNGIFSVIGFPKVFTPNGDGFNDTWQVKGISSALQPNSKIYIYNRYGKLLKELIPGSEGWDGTFNGNDVPVNDYWFSVTLEDGRTYNNHFTLKR